VVSAYLITTTPRSGSFLLVEGLSNCGLAGQPQEYATEEDTLAWRDFHRCTSHVEYFFRYLRMGATANGVFGAKLMPFQLSSWIGDARRYLGLRGAQEEVLRSMVGSFAVMRLIRHDHLRQAISWLRARGSGDWGQAPTDLGPPPDGTSLQYDAERLEGAIRALLAQEASWDRLLSRLQAPVSIVTYEDLASNYRTTVRRTLDFLGVPASAPLPEVPSRRRQADEITERWVERALRDLDPGLLARCGAGARD
jgi:trehalose 2-sulfotransferase